MKIWNCSILFRSDNSAEHLLLKRSPNRHILVHSDISNIHEFYKQLQAINAQNDKRQRQFDKLIDEWKKKVSDVQLELESSQKEARANASEVYKTKAQLEEAQEVIEGLRRENKNLSGALMNELIH